MPPRTSGVSVIVSLQVQHSLPDQAARSQAATSEKHGHIRLPSPLTKCAGTCFQSSAASSLVGSQRLGLEMPTMRHNAQKPSRGGQRLAVLPSKWLPALVHSQQRNATNASTHVMPNSNPDPHPQDPSMNGSRRLGFDLDGAERSSAQQGHEMPWKPRMQIRRNGILCPDLESETRFCCGQGTTRNGTHLPLYLPHVLLITVQPDFIFPVYEPTRLHSVAIDPCTSRQCVH